MSLESFWTGSWDGAVSGTLHLSNSVKEDMEV